MTNDEVAPGQFVVTVLTETEDDEMVAIREPEVCRSWEEVQEAARRLSRELGDGQSLVFDRKRADGRWDQAVDRLPRGWGPEGGST